MPDVVSLLVRAYAAILRTRETVRARVARSRAIAWQERNPRS